MTSRTELTLIILIFLINACSVFSPRDYEDPALSEDNVIFKNEFEPIDSLLSYLTSETPENFSPLFPDEDPELFTFECDYPDRTSLTSWNTVTEKSALDLLSRSFTAEFPDIYAAPADYSGTAYSGDTAYINTPYLFKSGSDTICAGRAGFITAYINAGYHLIAWKDTSISGSSVPSAGELKYRLLYE
ncbi:MAG: hypothetical protein ACLFQK_07500 [Fibrobacterota bacterium]